MRNLFYGAVCSIVLVVLFTMQSVRAQESLPPFVILGQCGVSFEACFNECRMTFPEGAAQWERGRLQCGNTCRKNRKLCETKAWSKLGITTQAMPHNPIPAVRPQTRQIRQHTEPKQSAVVARPVVPQQRSHSQPLPKEQIFQRTEKIENLYPQKKFNKPVNTAPQLKQKKYPTQVTEAYHNETRLPTGVNWSGFYIGGHAGYGVLDTDWTFDNIGGGQWTTSAGSTTGIEVKGFLGGGHAGINKQQSNWVYGFDISVSGGKIDGDIRNPSFPANESLKTKTNILVLAQAKLGWAQDDWLIFAQAGYAGAKNKLNLDTTVNGFNSDSDTAWHNGFTVGGGAAYRFGSWSLSLDYNYIELEKSLYSFSANGSPADKVSVEIKGHISKAAVNYHF